MGLLYGRAGRLSTKNAGFRPRRAVANIVVVDDFNDDRNADCANIRPDPEGRLVRYLQSFPKVRRRARDVALSHSPSHKSPLQ